MHLETESCRNCDAMVVYALTARSEVTLVAIDPETCVDGGYALVSAGCEGYETWRMRAVEPSADATRHRAHKSVNPYRHESVRLFEPAPTQLEGQMTF